MAHRPSAELVRTILDYDQETGIFLWKARPPDMFADGVHSAARNCAKWNARYAGTVAGTLNSNGYLQIKIFDSIRLAHRLAWLIVTGEWPAYEVDHWNLDPADNRWSNLREATPSQNCANKRAYSNNTSGLKGVSWSKQHQKWRAEIAKDGRKRHIGYSACPAAAHFAYLIEADKYFGKFARAA